jgi:protein SCO1/2
MTDPHPPATTTPAPGARRRSIVAGGLLVLVFGLLAVGLLWLVVVGREPDAGGLGAASATPGIDPATYAFAEPLAAPPLELTDQDGNAYSLAADRGRPVLVFFGYTHCPDVCPQTVGIVNEALAEVGDGPRAVFTTIDPERDDVAAMQSYLRYLPDAYVGLTGTPQEIHEAAVAWGVEYARIEQDSAAGYAMGHTANIYLVDEQGLLRASFPFGVTAEPIVAALRALLAEVPPAAAGTAASATPAGTIGPTTTAGAATTPTPAATATSEAATAAPESATPAPPMATELYPELVSTSLWAGGTDPVILRATDSTGTRLDGSIPLSVQVISFDGVPQGEPVIAEAVLPAGETQPSFVVPLTFPTPGAWKLHLVAGRAEGDLTVQARPQGSTPGIGGPAPAVDTPTLDDVGGVVRAVTTQPQPDLRLSETSTADALAMGKPYVLVIDSARFKVSPECGRALTMIRYLLDRWADDVVFVHLEPFSYQVITQEPVLSGTLTNPPLNEHAQAFGLGDMTWPATKMPWIFVVDGRGTIRAKYTGIVGSADIDVILTQIAQESRAGG